MQRTATMPRITAAVPGWGWALMVATLIVSLLTLAAYWYERAKKASAAPASRGPPPRVTMPSGYYRFRWGNSGLYIGIDQHNYVVLVPATQAITWSYRLNTAGTGGTLTATSAPHGRVLSTGPLHVVPMYLMVTTTPGTLESTDSWVLVRDPIDNVSSAGSLANTALGACAWAPPLNPAAGDAVTLDQACDPSTLMWYFETEAIVVPLLPPSPSSSSSS